MKKSCTNYLYSFLYSLVLLFSFIFFFHFFADTTYAQYASTASNPYISAVANGCSSSGPLVSLTWGATNAVKYDITISSSGTTYITNNAPVSNYSFTLPSAYEGWTIQFIVRAFGSNGVYVEAVAPPITVATCAPSAAITASPNPCDITPPAVTCSSQITYSTLNATNVQVNVYRNGTNAFVSTAASGPSGSFSFSGIDSIGYYFLVSATQGNPLPGGMVSVTGNIVNVQPIGNLDLVNCSTIQGWACDLNTVGSPTNVSLYADGNPLITTPANLNSSNPAVAAACGGNPNRVFSYAVPASLRDGNSHTIRAIAINTPAGVNPELGGSPKTFANCFNIPGAPAPSVIENQCTAGGAYGSFSSTRISWAAVAYATSYNVRRVHATNPAYNKVIATGTSATEVVDAAGDLPPNASVRYVVEAANAGYDGSDPSQQGTTAAVVTKNCYPPQLTSATFSCQSGAMGPNIESVWNEQASFVSGIARYELFRNPPNATVNANISGTSYRDDTVLPPNTFAYQVRSYSSLSNSFSPYSNIQSATSSYCDGNPPTVIIDQGSKNGEDPNGCFDETMITNGTPRAMDVVIQDLSPPVTPSGLNASSIQVQLENLTTGVPTVNWTNSGITQPTANTWRFLLTRALLVLDNLYRLSFRADDMAGNRGTVSYTFTFKRSCADWIKTTGGNVHSEGNINVPGGP